MVIIETKIRVFEGFAGIGAVSKSLSRLGIDKELVGFSEIDKYAIEAFCAIHGVDKSLNFGDVCLIDETKLPDFDLYTFGSPCQDFSVAGKQKGAVWTCSDCKDEHDNPTEWNPLDVHYSKRDFCPKCNSTNINKTRSSLIVEALRIIRHKKPKYLLMENVKNLVSKQFKPSFDKIMAELNEYGYNTYWDVLNAKDYGIPQSRDRVFVVSIRKDLDNGQFEFPKGFDNGLRLKHLLEKEVDSKYYLSEDVRKRFKLNQKENNNTTEGEDYKQPNQIIEDSNTLNKLGCIGADSQANRVYDINGVACTQVGLAGGLGAKTGLYLEEAEDSSVKGCSLRTRSYMGQPQQLEVRKDELSNTVTTVTKDAMILETQSSEMPMPELVGGIGDINFGKQFRQGNRVYSSEKTAMCLMAQPVGNAGGYSYLYTEPQNNFKIRKLTPLEGYRLMGFDDEDFYKVKNAGISDTQLYKTAGNSIVVNVLEAIFKNLLYK